MLKIARLIILSFFLVYRLSNVPSMTHRMLSHLLAFSHFEPPYKLERRSPSCTKARPRSVDISMKTKCIYLLPLSHLLYIDRPLSAILLIYSPYCLFALCLGQRAKVNSCTPWALFFVLGTLSSMNPTRVSVYILIPTFLSLAPLHFSGRFHYLRYVPSFYCFSLYQPTIDIPSTTELMHCPHPRPTIHNPILFTKLFSCFLCVIVVLLLGRG